ncbi:MAG: tetratricopeptide repeat protein [Hylemonella sp.]|nr:tetratricopeptide repeat protein [Hylemonella sp.]
MSVPELDRALAAINAGRFEEAYRGLEQLLRRSPGHIDARYLQGVAAQSLNRLDEALLHYNKVLKMAPQHSGAHYNKALALTGLERHSDALASHDAAIRLMPDNFWALVNRGNSQAALQRYQAALTDYDQALKIKPDFPEALTNKGNALAELGLFEQAVAHHQRALQIDPAHLPAWVNLSGTYIKARRFEQALEAADRAVQLHPENTDALVHKGVALTELGQEGLALTVLEQVTRLEPGHPLAWVSLGNAQAALLRYTDALASYDRGMARQPQSVQALTNKASALDDINQNAAAEECYLKALAVEPENPDTHWNLSVLLLKQSRFTDAWPHFEYRWDMSNSGKKQFATQHPRWDGQASERPLLLWGEQGIGDQTLYASILPELTDLPQRKTVALDKRLIPLFQRSMPGFEFIDLEQVSDALDFAEHLPLGSLPRLFRPDLDSFGRARCPFLLADAARAATLRNQVSRPGKLVCGVSWWSNRKGIGKHKSISLAQMLTPLASEPLHFVNLQYGDTATERDALQAQHGIAVQNVDEVNNFNDIDGLAALIEACDVVITTSNTTAHLAGALGKQTLLLLPSGKGRLWYWVEHEGHSLWYPSIMICQQTIAGDWLEPMRVLKAHLELKLPR